MDDLLNKVYYLIMLMSHEIEWINKHQKEVSKYIGKWVAITSSGIVASGESIKEIRVQLSEKRIEEQPLIMKIPRKDEEMSIL